MPDQEKAAKATFYLPAQLHHRLKIRSAVDGEAMSAIVERAVGFYLDHAEVVNHYEEACHGQTHQLYTCPDCTAALVIRDGELVTVQAAIAQSRGETLPPTMQGSGLAGELVGGELAGGDLVAC